MKPIKKIVAVTGKYKDRQTGQEKNQYVRAGTLFQRDDGSLCIKLDSLPLGEFNGWLNCYELDGETVKKDSGLSATPTPEFHNDDIPF